MEQYVCLSTREQGAAREMSSRGPLRAGTGLLRDDDGEGRAENGEIPVANNCSAHITSPELLAWMTCVETWRMTGGIWWTVCR